MNIDFADFNSSFDKDLRDYQVEYKTNIFHAWKTKRSVMLQMPTGTGKTRLFVSIIKDLQRSASQDKPKILVLAHRKELIEQIFKEISGKYQIPCSIIMSGNFESKAVPVQVASVPTLSREERLERWSSFDFDFIIIDESHHVKAKSYHSILRKFPNAKILGVTATPYRMSGRGFTGTFEELIEAQPVIQFIRQGYLCDYDYYSIQKLDNIHEKISRISKFDIEGDYSESEMMKIMDKKKVLSRIVDTYLNYANGKKGIVYTINQEHNKHVCEQFKQANIRAEAIDSNTKPELRENIVQHFRDGKIDVLCNVDIFSEGFDCPDVEFIQLARPTKSLALFLQQVGRGLRISSEKEKVIFLDVVGTYNRFGFPSTKRNWQTYFKGFNKLNPPDESPKNNEDEERLVNYIQTFEEGEDDLNLLDSTIDDESFRTFFEDIINRHKESPCHKEAYREYLTKKYCNGTIKNYIEIIPNHIDRFIKENYNSDFTTVYCILDPQILTKIKQALYSDNVFNNQYLRNQDRIANAIERYIEFAKKYFVEFNRSPEEKKAVDDANKNSETRNFLIKGFNNLGSDLVSILMLNESNEQSMPSDILEKVKELQESIERFKEKLNGI